VATFRALLSFQIRQALRTGQKSGPARFQPASLRRPIIITVIAVFVGVQATNWAGIWVGSHRTIARLAVVLLMQPILTTLGTTAEVALLFYAFTALLGVFVAGKELQLLLLSPISPLLVLGERILLTSLTFSLILTVASPALVALGMGTGTAAPFYPAIYLALLLLPIAPVSLAVILLTGLMRVIPPAQAKTLSTVIGLLVSMTLLIGSRVLVGGLGGFSAQLPLWLPTTWPGRFLTAVALSSPRSAIGYGILMFVFAAAPLLAGTALSARAFATGLSTYAESPRRASSRRARTSGLEPKVRPVGPVRLMIGKDLKSIRRDALRLLLYVYPLVIIGFNFVQLLARGQADKGLLATGTTLILLLVASLLLVTTTAPAVISGEGRCFILLALSPISPQTVMAAKWLLSWLPPMVLVEAALFGLGAYLGIASRDVLVLGLLLALYLAAQVGICLGANLTWPRFEQLNPRRPSSGQASATTLIGGAALGAGSGILTYVGMFVWSGRVGAVTVSGVLVGLTVIAFLAFQVGVRQLAHLSHSELLLSGAS